MMLVTGQRTVKSSIYTVCPSTTTFISYHQRNPIALWRECPTLRSLHRFLEFEANVTSGIQV
ncbi:hypothetical protein [Spirosoma terrae]|uniref:Uncharacterized protein n=1 Tax=Spirosoma terrae TaxID=1968276 RepID=A0A6L9LA93_9BACT|nr:hypothetical protein [Spirosoma terrae]NDU97436.1 hypothetical protein [Spirosoma terrae]